MGRVVTLVTTGASSDTVHALTYLLQEARAGRVVGVAYVAMHKAHDFSIDHAGEIKRYPLPAIGAIRLLADQLIGILKK